MSNGLQARGSGGDIPIGRRECPLWKCHEYEERLDQPGHGRGGEESLFPFCAYLSFYSNADLALSQPLLKARTKTCRQRSWGGRMLPAGWVSVKMGFTCLSMGRCSHQVVVLSPEGTPRFLQAWVQNYSILVNQHRLKGKPLPFGIWCLLFLLSACWSREGAALPFPVQGITEMPPLCPCTFSLPNVLYHALNVILWGKPLGVVPPLFFT